VQNQYGVSISVSASVNLFFSASLKVTGSFEWTNTNSYGTSTGSTQSATATIGGPAFGYSGSTDVLVYWDSIYNSFMFAFAGGQPTATGTLLDAAGKAVANKLVTLTVGGKTFKTLTNARGEYRFYETPSAAGQGAFVVDGRSFPIAPGTGTAAATVRLPS
jgi:hypothetical protein